MTQFAPIKWSGSSFGELLDFEMPAGCDVIIVGVQKHQLVPVCVLLPHQAYREKLGRILAEHGSDEIYIIPYRNSDLLNYSMAAIRDEHEKKTAAPSPSLGSNDGTGGAA